MQDFNIGITGTGSLIGQNIIKCIKQSKRYKDSYLVGFDYFPNTIGSYWCNSNFILPDCFKKDIPIALWLENIAEVILKSKIDFLFIGIDFELPVFSKHKKSLEMATGVKIIVSNEDVIRIANDKYLTYEFLKDNNFPYPISYIKDNFSFDKLDFPFIIKPRIGARSHGFNIVNNVDEYNEAIKEVEDPIIQEYLSDNESEYTCGVMVLDGEFRESIILRRTLKEGNTWTAVHENSPKNDVIKAYIESVSLKLQPYGSCNYQLRLEKGVPKLFEINARHSGTTYMRALFGYNEIEYILNALTNNEIEKKELKYGKVLRYFDDFLVNE